MKRPKTTDAIIEQAVIRILDNADMLARMQMKPSKQPLRIEAQARRMEWHKKNLKYIKYLIEEFPQHAPALRDARKRAKTMIEKGHCVYRRYP